MIDPLDLARSSALAAGRILLEGFGRHPAFTTKQGPTDLVTEYDRRSEALLLERLRSAFPDDTLIAEESSAAGPRSSRRWLIDPLDGTVNFAHGLPQFCVSIAREVDGHVEAAVVHAPALDLTFTAERGGGAHLNGAPIRVSDESTLARSLLTTGFPYDRQTSDENNFAQFCALQRRAQGVRRIGSAALDLAWVAQGIFDGYWEMKLKPWDVAAGALLVAEAGGRMSDWHGGVISSAAIDRGAIVATNGRIHDELLATLKEVGLPRAVS